MKLILENWRHYLNERESDEAYQKIIDFLIDTIFTREFVEVESEDLDPAEEAELLAFFKIFTDRGDTASPGPPPPKEFEVFIDEDKIDYLANLYKTKILDDSDDQFKKVFNTNALENLLENFSISVIYAPGDWREKFEETGSEEYAYASRTMGYFAPEGSGNRGPEIAINFGNIIEDMSLEEFSALSEEEVFNKLKSYKDSVRTVLDHEFTHFLNAVRHRGDSHMQKNRGLKDPKDIYINSTEEIQSRIIQTYTLVNSFLNARDEAIPEETKENLKELPSILKSIEKDESARSRTAAMRKIVAILKNEYTSRYPWERTLPIRQKLIIKRFFDIAKALINKNKKNNYPTVERLTNE
jgi:hypothetical protein